MGKLIDFTSRYGDEYTLAFEVARYCYGGGLAIEVHCRERGSEWWEPYATLTVNIDPVGENEAYLDSNNVPDLVDLVIGNGWAKRVGEGHSGFCTYPLVEFTQEFLEGICLDAEKGDTL